MGAKAFFDPCKIHLRKYCVVEGQLSSFSPYWKPFPIFCIQKAVECYLFSFSQNVILPFCLHRQDPKPEEGLHEPMEALNSRAVLLYWKKTNYSYSSFYENGTLKTNNYALRRKALPLNTLRVIVGLFKKIITCCWRQNKNTVCLSRSKQNHDSLCAAVDYWPQVFYFVQQSRLLKHKEPEELKWGSFSCRILLWVKKNKQM